jgi:hypothetical protein
MVKKYCSVCICAIAQTPRGATPAAIYPKDPIYPSKQKHFNACYEKWQKDLPAMWSRLYCSLAPAPFGENIFASSTIDALSLPEL